MPKSTTGNNNRIKTTPPKIKSEHEKNIIFLIKLYLTKQAILSFGIVFE